MASPGRALVGALVAQRKSDGRKREEGAFENDTGAPVKTHSKDSL